MSSSPFLLNATVNQHLETYREADSAFVDQFLSSIYVDDLVTGCDDVESAHEFYLKSKLRLAAAGFKLRKFVTNSPELRDLIANDETSSDSPHTEEDQSYAKASLGVKVDDGRPGITKVLGVQWNVHQDQLEFDMREIAQAMEELEPSKRNLVSITAKFFDPLGVVSPVTVLFKMSCQQLCVAKVGWDETLSGPSLERWNQLCVMLQGTKIITIPRCVHHAISPNTMRLVGFCDASAKAYAAVVYLRLEDDDTVDVQFLAAKTRVTPVLGVTIPRLELLSALLLAKLLTSIQNALHTDLPLDDPICFTDSKATMYWIRGVQHEWKQFVENRVTTIRNLVHPDRWHHCPGKENPADIPSRGMSASALPECPLWLNGPDWLWHKTGSAHNEDSLAPNMPEDCWREMKGSDPMSSIVAVNAVTLLTDMGQVIDLRRYSSSHHLCRVTALVLRFVARLREGAKLTHATVQPSTGEIERAKLMWIKDMQARLSDGRDFSAWRNKLDLFVDRDGLWRCGGRMSNSTLSPAAQHPILLDKDHHLTSLLILDAHRRVLHDGVRETLAELRSVYWVVRGRQVVKKLLCGCTTCRRHEGAPCKGVPSPPLPGFRVSESQPFQTTGVDFAGPLYVKASDPSATTKTWMVLYTCYSTRAVHLDLVQDMTAQTFLRSLRRFTARRGTPAKMVSDNAKTFKSASVSIANTLRSLEVKKFLGVNRIEWQFNLEKAPWQGGAFERMIKSAKRCLRKAIGKSGLSFDELLTLVIEVEGVLNSRPLTYVYDTDVTEPLTPSHLLVGYRILSLPDTSLSDDPADDYSPGKISRRSAHLARTLDHFWRRWKREYLLELREFHRTGQRGGGSCELRPGEVVTVYDENHPRGMWRLGRVESLLPGTDGRVRGVSVRVVSKSGRVDILRRPVQHIYPLEIRPTEPVETSPTVEDAPTPEVPKPIRSRPVRKAAVRAIDKIKKLAVDDDL